MMRICPNCGKQLPEGSTYCSGCGKSLAVKNTYQKNVGPINVGQTIKTFSIIVSVVMFLVCLIWGIILCEDCNEEFGVPVIIVGGMSSGLLFLFNYGFGELINRVCKIEETINGKIIDKVCRIEESFKDKAGDREN